MPREQKNNLYLRSNRVLKMSHSLVYKNAYENKTFLPNVLNFHIIKLSKLYRIFLEYEINSKIYIRFFINEYSGYVMMYSFNHFLLNLSLIIETKCVKIIKKGNEED